jgi:hypothetical protein
MKLKYYGVKMAYKVRANLRIKADFAEKLIAIKNQMDRLNLIREQKEQLKKKIMDLEGQNLP